MARHKKMFTIIGIVLIVAVIGVGVWWYRNIWHGCNPQLPEEQLTVGSAQFTVEMATTMTQQACGLSGRTGLADGHGMLFLFSSPNIQNFWMKDMNFALDMVWISDDKVVGFAQDVPPPMPGEQLWELKIYTSPPGVDKVLEIPAGTVAKDGIQVGDVVK